MEQLTAVANKWTLTEKMLFRFFFVYFVLYCFPFPVITFQFTQPLTYPFMGFMEWLVPKVGILFFNWEIENSRFAFRLADSGFGIIYLFINLVLALLITLLWSIADRRRINYERLNEWFLLYIRYYLAFTILEYGINKVIPVQGGFITASVLEKPLGMMNAAMLQWKFLAYSNSYKIFTGLGEVVGALLILWRRTATLGAMLLVAVLSVVVMLNFCFGIGVKISSLHYLFIAFLIIWNDRKRLLNLFLLNRSSAPVIYTPLIRSFFWSRLFTVFLIFLVVCRLYQLTERNNANWKRVSNFSQKPLYGIYTTEYFIRGIDTMPALQTDSLRWKKITIETIWDVPRVYIHLSTDSVISSRAQIDTVQKTIQFEIKKDSLKLNWSSPDSNRLLFCGQWKNDSIKVMTRKYDLNNYPLHREKFQWTFD
jgi:hypothetical protein